MTKRECLMTSGGCGRSVAGGDDKLVEGGTNDANDVFRVVGIVGVADDSAMYDRADIVLRDATI
jgi:hypothetical protein